jgi:hypothetical protein
MKLSAHFSGLLVVAMALVSGCASNVRVGVEHDFPEVVAKPRELNVALVMNPAFRSYEAQPTEKIRIQFGPAQADLLTKAFNGLFAEVKVVSSKNDAGPGTDLVITPSVREVQLSTPSDSYLNVYEVWIKYNLNIETPDGVPIDSWFLPAYGKTPYSYMLSRGTAIEEATVIALRDAGAKLMLDFFRIPAINGWIQQRQAALANP